MAIVGGVQDEEEQQQQQSAGRLPVGSAPTGGEGGYVSGGGEGGPTTKAGAGAGSAPTSSGGYTNLTSYLQANDGSGATTGKAAGNVVRQASDDATASREAYGGAARSEIDRATDRAGVDQDVLNGINSGSSWTGQVSGGPMIGDSSSYASLGPKKSRQATLPGGVTVGDSSSYAGSALPTSATYSGPNDTAHFSGDTMALQTKAMGDNDLLYGAAKNANGGQAGVSALLKSAYQQPSYTRGENNLDAFLAGGTPGGKAELGKATGYAAGAEGGYKALNESLTSGIKAGQDTAAATNKTYDTARADKAKRDADAAAAAEAAAAAAAAMEPTVGDYSTYAEYTPPKQNVKPGGPPKKPSNTMPITQVVDNAGGAGPSPISVDMLNIARGIEPYVQPGNVLEAAGLLQPEDAIGPGVRSTLNKATNGNYDRLRERLTLGRK